ncbi:MAG: hypothetical protein SFX73_34650 [Kofleriaceae bacterium]|nr:hypothetical protein [Kofleriaceae bacterium]
MKHGIGVIVVLTLALGGLGGLGCGSRARANEVLGLPTPPAGYASTTVEELVRDEGLGGQRVFFEGAIAKFGCLGCGGVIAADKTWRISIEPEDPSQFRIPVRSGVRIRVWGVLQIGNRGFREVKARRVEFPASTEEEKS